MDTAQLPAPRTPLLVKVSFRRNYARDEGAGVLKNVSLSGAFLQHSGEALHSGDKLYMTFSVSGRERVVPGIVVWTNSSGSGIKFNPTNKRDTQIVDDLIYFVENKRSGSREILNSIFKKVA